MVSKFLFLDTSCLSFLLPCGFLKNKFPLLWRLFKIMHFLRLQKYSYIDLVWILVCLIHCIHIVIPIPTSTLYLSNDLSFTYCYDLITVFTTFARIQLQTTLYFICCAISRDVICYVNWLNSQMKCNIYNNAIINWRNEL